MEECQPSFALHRDQQLDLIDDICCENKSKDSDLDNDIIALDGDDVENGDVDDDGTSQPPDEDLEEQQNFFDILNTFRYYKSALLRRVRQNGEFLDRMPESQQQKLIHYRAHLDQLKLAIMHNYEVIKEMIADVTSMFKNAVYLQGKHKLLKVKTERQLDTDRINSVLNQIVREWTTQGRAERDVCFEPILSSLERHFGNVDERARVKVLVPGVGLGRLSYEVARRGFSCQGNEFSLMMLFVSNFILNKSLEPNSLTFYPWVSHFTNNLKCSDQLTAVKFPDVTPNTIPDGVNFSMAAGNFVDIYSRDVGKWNSVITCFFLDTAPNVVTYIETIQNILSSGGIWINFGPLLYHYADMPDHSSIEPSYEIVREVILSSGFVFLEERTNIDSFYTRNPNSMLSYQYKSVFFVCQKRPEEGIKS